MAKVDWDLEVVLEKDQWRSKQKWKVNGLSLLRRLFAELGFNCPVESS